jgi:hypothetical protein
MVSIQQRIASLPEQQLTAIATTSANLKAQFRELETLRDRVRKTSLGRRVTRRRIPRINAARSRR